MPMITIMGIVNVTPDSFSDGGRYESVMEAVDHALNLEDEGAHILDIGGESTRPGAAEVSIDEEIARVLPVIKALRGNTAAKISIDTRKPAVARVAIEAGADIWNDVSALTFAPESLQLAADLQVPVVLMHAQGDPETMQDEPHYENVVEEVFTYLRERIEACERAGLGKAKLILDPGIGFGKKLEHNLSLINGLGRLAELDCPVLLGASRKRFIAAADRDDPAQTRLGGSIAAVLAGVRAGADWVRVHDVAATRQALNLHFALESARNKPAQK